MHNYLIQRMKTKFNSFSNIHIVWGILSLVLLGQTAFAETWFTNEFWISPVAQTNWGNGTLDYPYDGSTQAKFDTVMGSLPPNSTVHLLAGTYQTYGTGAWNLQTGQKILGSGIDNTIVKLVPNAGNGGFLCAMGVAGNASYSNIVVADLTVDAGFSPDAIDHDGIYLAGSHHTIRKVKVINFGVTDDDNSYAITIGYCAGMGTANCEGNVVEDCEVGPVLGDGGDGIVFNGGPNNWISGIIQNNRTSSSIRGAWMCNALIEGNTVNGPSIGFSAVGGGFTNIMVAHNVFENCRYAIFLSSVTGQNLSFCYNTLTFTDGTTAFTFWYDVLCSDIIIVGNYIGSENPPGSGQFLWGNTSDNITGMLVANNMVDPGLSSIFSGCTGVSMYCNYDLQGNLRTDLDTMGFSTMTPFGIGFLASPNNSAALTSLGLPGNPAVILTNNQSQPVTFSTNVTVYGTLNYSNMVAQLLAGTGVTTSTVYTPTGQVVTVNANVPATFANEFWISTNTATANLGTLSDPFDGSTQVKFDSVMDSLPPNSTIHILAGTYQTLGNLGGWGVKSGQKILGSGIDVTIVQLASGASDQTFILGTQIIPGTLGQISATNAEISDLTCDGNYTSGSYTYHGVSLVGTENAVRRVKVINLAKFGGSSESFGIALGNESLSDSEGNIIEECEVSHFAGGTGGISAICLNGGQGYGISGIIRNNRVFLDYDGFGINGSFNHDVLIEENYIVGANDAYYGDTGGSTNIIVAHNAFCNCGHAVSLNGSLRPRKNITIAFNDITLTNPPGYNFIYAFGTWDSGSSFTNVTIVGNNVALNGPIVGTADVFSFYNATGLICADNKIDGSLGSTFSNCANVNIYNNHDLYGNFLTNLNQVASPNGMTRRTVTYSGTGIYTNYAGYADKYIGVKGFSGGPAQEVDIFLPSAVGHPGKDIVVVDETGLANSTTKLIKIKPISPNQVNGGTSVSITAPYTAKTFISDGVNWFAR